MLQHFHKPKVCSYFLHMCLFLRELEDLVETVPTTPAVWSEARSLAARSRRDGVTVPATDLLIFAAARVHRLALLHRDTHFDQLAGLD